MHDLHPLSVLDAFKVYAAAYVSAYRELNGHSPNREQLVESFQAVKHHKYNAATAAIIGKCDGVMNS